MSDPLAWLKLGQRSRTPSNPLSSSSPDCKAGRERTLSDLRRPGSSRLSGHLGRADTGLDSLFSEDAEDDVAANLFVRNQDRIWYNPSLDQMVEALQVLLMTRGVLEPIPLEYNSYILHLIEGFAKARADTRKAEAAHTELKQTLEQNLEQFRLVAEDWRQKEAQYLAEIKKLEVLLSKSSKDGLEVVALARTTSVIDRYSNRRRGFLSRLDEIRRDHFDSSGRPPVPTTPRILDNDNDFLISEKFRKQDAIVRDSAPVSRERRATDLQSGAPIKKSTAAAAAAASSSSSKSPETVIKAPIATTVVTEERPSDEEPKPGPEATTKGSRSVFRGAFSLKRGRHGASETRSPKAKHEVVVGPSNPGHQENTAEDRPATSSTESSLTLTPGTAHRHERGGSTFSFEAGDDCIPLLGNPAEGYGDFDTASYRQTPTPESSGAAAEECRRRTDVDGVGDAGKERKEIDSVRYPTTATTVQSPSTARHRPLLRRGRDSGGGGGSSKKTTTSTAQSSPSQSCHVQDEGQQEGSEKAQTETEARIAAKFALANAFGGGKRKK
ncbi:hypothetical protein FHL15_006059 [Xylaria flabelliformis]|uniref:Uncharacterized protein n=1 Tax=Xylaria flabelliformis TaxID=2512241 RepID=A0A553HY97_9PEZI|nr:hypothetical protein FHL15_006059 [Xylaria flabelliformis]